MLTKLLEIIITLLMFILKLVLNIILLLFPTLEMSGFDVGVNAFLGMMNNAVNMTRFLVGTGYVLYFDLAFIIWTTRHSVLPIVCVVRKFLAKG